MNRFSRTVPTTPRCTGDSASEVFHSPDHQARKHAKRHEDEPDSEHGQSVSSSRRRTSQGRRPACRSKSVSFHASRAKIVSENGAMVNDEVNTRARLLAAYDAQLRTDTETPSAISVTRLGPLRLVTFAGGHGFVTYHDLGDVNADDVRRLVPEALNHYRSDPGIKRGRVEGARSRLRAGAPQRPVG